MYYLKPKVFIVLRLYSDLMADISHEVQNLLVAHKISETLSICSTGGLIGETKTRKSWFKVVLNILASYELFFL